MRVNTGAVIVASIAALTTAIGTAGAANASTRSSAARVTHYATTKQVCSAPKAGHASCLAIRRDAATKSTPDAQAYSVPAALPLGPKGGYTPGDIATAYGVDPAGGAGQTVAIIGAYDDPTALTDLNTFDEQYGIAEETTGDAPSFEKVGQTGSTTALPASGVPSGWDVEESLDVQALRGLCHGCRILLVEADDDSANNLAIAVDEAVTLGATIVSNSYGSQEEDPSAPGSKAIEAAYNHPGVVMLASTGDDGWYDWSYYWNNYVGSSYAAPEDPASYPTVIGVGGTSLSLNQDASRQSETVWNNTGPVLSGIDAGATGGGCSPHFFAPFWQAGVANYAATGCGGARQSGDVAVVGDPYTGYDILDSSASTNPGWMTIGGTSLSSPLMAALWALAGGSHGVYYPGATLYANFTHHPSTLFDVTQGSNGVCDEAPASCASDWGSALGDVGPDNPNNTFYCADQACDNGTVWLDLDCAFAPDQNGANSTALVAHYNQCYAAPGYDGPSGVGVPDGLGAFAKPTATATISGPLDVNKRSAAFKAVIHDTVPGGTVSAAKWTFSDAAASKSGATVRHFSQRAGTFTAKVIVSDGVGVLASASRRFTIGYAPRVTVSLPSVIKENKAVTFTAKATDRNTSGRIRSYLWSFGHGITAHGARATHKWGIPGVHHVTLTVTDNQHNVTTKTITVRVRK